MVENSATVCIRVVFVHLTSIQTVEGINFDLVRMYVVPFRISWIIYLNAKVLQPFYIRFFFSTVHVRIF